MGEREHAGQGIVEFVCDTGSEQPNRRQLLSPRSLSLCDIQFMHSFFYFLFQRTSPVLQLGVRIAQRFGHAVKGCCQLTEFVFAADGNGLVQVSLGKLGSAVFQITKRQVNHTVHQETHQQCRSNDESQRKTDDGDCICTYGAVDLVQRIHDIQHTEYRLVCRMHMAPAIRAAGLVTDHGRAAKHSPAFRVGKNPRSADHATLLL